MNSAYSAWREGARYYLPLLVLGGGILASTWGSTYAWIAAPFLFFGMFSLFFFRDPARSHKARENELLSPADGTVVGIEDLAQSPHYSGPCRRLSIFLSVFNVHVNRSPIAGTVTAIEYRPGLFRNAMKAETTDCNEANGIKLDTAYGPITIRQISGAVARRIICRAKPGDSLGQGERFGMIKFGSRTELYLPPHTQICVKIGDKVAGGRTVVARFEQEAS